MAVQFLVGFLKLLLSAKSVCLCACVRVCVRVSAPEAINYIIVFVGIELKAQVKICCNTET